MGKPVFTVLIKWCHWCGGGDGGGGGDDVGIVHRAWKEYVSKHNKCLSLHVKGS